MAIWLLKLIESGSFGYLALWWVVIDTGCETGEEVEEDYGYSGGALTLL